MATATVLQWKSFDFSKLVYSPVAKKSGKGQTTVEVQYDDNGTLRPIVFQTPTLKLPFGIKMNVDKASGNETYACDFQFNGILERVQTVHEVDAEGKPMYVVYGDDKFPKMVTRREFYPQDGNATSEMFQFIQFLSKLDAYNKKMTFRMHEKWMGVRHEPNVIDTFYKPIVRPSKAPEQYSPTLSCNCIYGNGTFKTGFFREDGEQIRERDMILQIPKFTPVIGLIHATGLWFSSNSFGMKFKCGQMMVFPSTQYANFGSSCAIQMQPQMQMQTQMAPPQGPSSLFGAIASMQAEQYQNQPPQLYSVSAVRQAPFPGNEYSPASVPAAMSGVLPTFNVVPVAAVIDNDDAEEWRIAHGKNP